jgi:hypothetical protein
MCETEYALGIQCGITFAGIKPASLFAIRKNERVPLNYYIKSFYKKGFRFVTMREKNNRALLYVYNQNKLRDVLFQAENRQFLNESGYQYKTVGQAVCQLKAKIRNNFDFPHEIGVFLGYPLEDVKGFIADPDKGVLLGGYWKVYGNCELKARQFRIYRECAESIKQKLLSGKPLAEIFNVA